MMTASKEKAHARHTGRWPRASVCPPVAALDTAPGLARAHVRDVLAQWHLQAMADPAELIVSELVTNVVRQATDAEGHPAYYRNSGTMPVFRLALFADHSTLIIQVQDDLPGTPRRQQAEDDDESGRGLMIVESLSDDWGTSPLDSGKIVYARLRLPAATDRASSPAESRRAS